MREEFRVFVLGAVNFTDRELISEALDYAESRFPFDRSVIVGCLYGRTRGLDVYSSRMMLERGWEIEEFSRDHVSLLSEKDKIRDEIMMESGVDLVLLFEEDGHSIRPKILEMIESCGVEMYVSVKNRNWSRRK